MLRILHPKELVFLTQDAQATIYKYRDLELLPAGVLEMAITSTVESAKQNHSPADSDVFLRVLEMVYMGQFDRLPPLVGMDSRNMPFWLN